MGVIAGGMLDGQINIWDPMEIVNGADGLISVMHHHQGAVQGLHFNPHKDSATLLASGGNDGEVYVISLEDPSSPVVFTPAESGSKHSADVTKVAWNTQVPHILASCSQNGSCIIWDLKQKKAWCELRDPAGGAISDIAWNPEQGLNIITASGDDKNPVIKLWDLRSSTSLPLLTLQGHTEGVLSVTWCPSDPSLLLSCAKDNRTVVWDLYKGKQAFDLPSDETATGSGNNFGGINSAAGQRKYFVCWSPCLPAVIATCSFDRTVQFYSLSGFKSSLGRAPKWLKRPAGASFGFGGKLVHFSSRGDGKTEQKKGAHVTFAVHQVAEDPSLVVESDHFHTAIASNNLIALCEQRALNAATEHEREEWNVIRVLCFEANTREKLNTYLGFEKSAIDNAARLFAVSHQSGEQGASVPSMSASEAKDVFQADPSTPPRRTSVSLTLNETAAVEAQLAIEREAEPMIRDALVVGNFSAAVDCCLEAGLMAEALLLSQCGDASLWEKTQKAFFERQKRVHRLPFLDMLQAVIRNELRTFVEQSSLHKWRETLALLSTYGKTEEFPVMCELLAHRLETELKDYRSARICYMCSMNTGKAIALWVDELRTANAAAGGRDDGALWKFVMKVVTFTHASPNQDLGPECAAFFSEYAHILASHGRLDTAPRYIKGDNASEVILRDRVYHASSKHAAGGARPPPFPFNRVTVSVSGPSQTAAFRALEAAKADKPIPTDTARSATSNEWDSAGAAARTSSHRVERAQPVQPAAKAVSSYEMAPASNYESSLPAGWLKLQDPASGRPYYANQSAGITQWEEPAHPQSAPVNQPVVQPAVNFAASTASSYGQQQAAAAVSTPVAAAQSAVSGEAVVALHHIVTYLDGIVVSETF